MIRLDTNENNVSLPCRAVLSINVQKYAKKFMILFYKKYVTTYFQMNFGTA